MPTVALLNSHQTLGDFLESLIFARTVADRMDAKLAVQFANDRPYKRPLIGLLQGDKDAVYTGGADLVLETATSTATGASCRAWASWRASLCRTSMLATARAPSSSITGRPAAAGAHRCRSEKSMRLTCSRSSRTCTHAVSGSSG